MGDVRLVDLDVFKHYSLALRQEWAPVDELLAVLEATRRQVEEVRRQASPARRRVRRPAGGAGRGGPGTAGR